MVSNQGGGLRIGGVGTKWGFVGQGFVGNVGVFFGKNWGGGLVSGGGFSVKKKPVVFFW